ncbi:MAG: hypothetical protein IIA82_05720 [Thaumarchaeota archaeon]|nr:hypothetical protein [Nitrososphaerota archaeon]
MINLNPFHKKPKMTYTLPTVCRVCFKEIHPYASLCNKCAREGADNNE